MLDSRRRIVFVALARQMKKGGVCFFVSIVRLPIAGYAPADSDHAAQNIRMREREPIIQSARLGESEKENIISISDALISQFRDHFKQRVMMNRHRFFRSVA